MPSIRILCIGYILLQIAFCFAWRSHAQVNQVETGISRLTESIYEHRKIDKLVHDIYEEREKDPELTIKKLEEVGQRSIRAGYAYGYAKADMAIANIIVNQKPDQDILRALAIQRRIKDIILYDPKAEPWRIQLWYQQMGSCFGLLSELDSAMHYYSKALNIVLRKKKMTARDTTMMAINYLNLSGLFLEMDQTEKAIYYAIQCAKVSADKGLGELLFRSYITLATAYTKLKNIDSVARYITLLDGVDYKLPDLEKKNYYDVIGSYYFLKNEPALAIQYFEKSVAIDSHHTPIGYRGLGNCHRLLGNYQLAEENLLMAKGLLLSGRSSNVMLAEVYGSLAAVNDSLGNFQEAYRYRSSEGILQKEIDDAVKIRIINQQEGAFRKAEQDKLLAENDVQLLKANTRLSNQRSWIAGISLVALLLLAIAGILYQKQKLQKQRSKTAIRDQEIEKLKAGIEAEEKERSRIGRELHDNIMVQLSLVKMNLEALPAQIPGIEKMNDFVSVKEQLHIAGRDLRQTAHNLSPDTLLADGLTQALLYFLKNVQYRTKLNVNFQHYGQAPALPQETEINIYRIVQELVQNIIKHARAKSILIQLNYREDTLTLTIEDDGIGFESVSRTDEEGIGLKSIRSRLEVMNGTMDIHTRHPQGTSITIEINV